MRSQRLPPLDVEPGRAGENREVTYLRDSQLRAGREWEQAAWRLVGAPPTNADSHDTRLRGGLHGHTTNWCQSGRNLWVGKVRGRWPYDKSRVADLAK